MLGVEQLWWPLGRALQYLTLTYRQSIIKMVFSHNTIPGDMKILGSIYDKVHDIE